MQSGESWYLPSLKYQNRIRWICTLGSLEQIRVVERPSLRKFLIRCLPGVVVGGFSFIMVLKVSEVSGSLDRYHGDFDGTEGSEGTGLLRASFPNFGENFVGGMTLRFNRTAVCTDPPASSCGSTLSVSSNLSTSPSKPSVMSASSVSSKPIPIVLQKKHSPYTEKGQFHTWIDAMRAQSPTKVQSCHEDIPQAFGLEAAVYKSWLVSIFALYSQQNYPYHIERPGWHWLRSMSARPCCFCVCKMRPYINSLMHLIMDAN